MEDSFTLKDFFKKLGFFKEISIYKRIHDIYRYTVMFDFKDDRLRKIVENKDNVYFEFKSNLGTIRIDIEKHYSFWGDYRLEYSNYAGSTVFTINTTDTEILYIEPMLGEDLTAKDIDMALYELELYLKTTYGDVEDEWLRYTNYKQYQKRLHKEEMDKLR